MVRRANVFTTVLPRSQRVAVARPAWLPIARPRLHLPKSRSLACRAVAAGSRGSIDEDLNLPLSPPTVPCSSSPTDVEAQLRQQQHVQGPQHEPHHEHHHEHHRHHGHTPLSTPPSPPPPLTVRQLQRLTELHVRDPYGLGIVSSPAELAQRVGTSLHEGLCSDQAELTARALLYGTNETRPTQQTTLWELVLDALKDFTVIILLVAGSTSLALDFLLIRPDASGNGGPSWIEGTSILASVAVVVLVTGLNNWQKERQFQALQAVEQDVTVRVIRDGREQELPTSAVMVGELLLLEAGDILCADGLLLEGVDVRVDESHLTGESDDRPKDARHSPAMLSGSKVVSGHGHVLVTCVGPKIGRAHV